MQETDSQSQEQATATKVASAPAKSRTLWGDAFKRLRKNKLAVIGVCWIIIVVVVALTADLWAKPWLGSPTASDSIRQHNRCKLTGRPKGYIRLFGISRIQFRSPRRSRSPARHSRSGRRSRST